MCSGLHEPPVKRILVGEEIQCMFWCMLVSDITAIYCDILQCLTGAQTFHSLYVMRICAVTCGLLQQFIRRTQNPWVADRSWIEPRYMGRASNCEPSSKAGNWLRELIARDLFLHGQDREQNFTKFFTELCAAGTPNTPVRSSILH